MKPRVLVVDDEPRFREALRDFLTAKDYSVDEAATGVEGLHRLRETCPEVVLLDINLPDRSGLEVLCEIKRLHPAVGVMIITGLHDEEVGQAALNAGAFDYITKPLDLSYLENSLWYKITTMTLDGVPNPGMG